jgi:hypothetical protein
MVNSWYHLDAYRIGAGADMSTFNTPPGPRIPANAHANRPPAAAITGAIRKAAQSTGADFEHLLATAKVESNLNPNLTMQTSTATGLFQFLDQTWLGVMHSAGRAFGFERYADAITQTKSGQYVVQDPALRDEMMKLRKDPAVNAAMGGVFTQQNAAVLGKRIGRRPTDGELYIAHFFGPYAASKVIGLAKSNPTVNAAEMFPAAAAANRPIFYDKLGNARSVAGVYNELVRRYDVARARMTPDVVPAVVTAGTPSPSPAVSARNIPKPSEAAPVRNVAPVRDTAGITAVLASAGVQSPKEPAGVMSFAPVTAAAPAAPAPGFRPVTRTESASVFHSLFGTEGPRGPLSAAVGALWGGSEARTPVDAEGPVAPIEPSRDARPPVRRLTGGRG